MEMARDESKVGTVFESSQARYLKLLEKVLSV